MPEGPPLLPKLAPLVFGYEGPKANYLFHLSRKFRYIYAETPKVGCTTVKRILQLAEVDGDDARTPANPHDRSASPLLQPKDDLDWFIGGLADESVMTFCFVRNPYERVLSCYLDKMVKNAFERQRLAPALGLSGEEPPSFAAFLDRVRSQDPTRRDIHWATQADLLRPTRVRYARIGRFETFSQDLGAVLEELKVPVHRSIEQRRNETGSASRLHDFYGPDELAIVRQVYQADFEAFGYGWGLPR